MLHSPSPIESFGTHVSLCVCMCVCVRDFSRFFFEVTDLLKAEFACVLAAGVSERLREPL